VIEIKMEVLPFIDEKNMIGKTKAIKPKVIS
jgi:hypothetical protein